MANLLIMAPLPVAAVAASRGTGADNLLSPDPREVWADSAVGSAATIEVDFGAVRRIDTVFLGHLFPPADGATWTLDCGFAAHGETMIAGAAPLRVPDVPGHAPALSHAFWHGAPVSLRYLRLAVTQAAGAAPLTAGVLLAGLAFQPRWNREWGGGRRPIDSGSATQLSTGGFAIAEGERKSAWYWTLGDLEDDELDVLYDITLDRGETRPLLVVEDPASTAGLRRRLHYGLFQQLRQYERQRLGRTRWELTLAECSSDEAVLPGMTG